MLPDPPETDHLDDVVLWRFNDQTRLGHAVAALGGFALWIGTFAIWLEVLHGNVHVVVADRPAGIAARQEAMMVATVACYVWFSVAFMLGKGGPFVNLFVYPIVWSAIGPTVTALTVAGWVSGSFSTGSTFASPVFILDVVRVFLPGLLVGSALVVGFLVGIFYVTGTGSEWEQRHMPEVWHEHKRQFEDDATDGAAHGSSGRD